MTLDATPQLAPDPLRAFADVLLDAARQTQREHAPVRLTIGGVRVALHFDGPATSGALLPAWRSLLDRDAVDAPDATLLVRTQAASGRPPVFLGADDATVDAVRGSARGSSDVIDYALVPRTGAVALWDDAARTGVWWGPRPELMSVNERVMPLGPLLRWVLRSLAVTVVPGGVAGSTRGGLLVVGPRGSGRSTTVLAARRLGLAAIADDVVAVDPVTLAAFAMSGFATVDDRTLRLMPELVGRLAQLPRMADGKRAVVLDERPLRLPGGMPLRAIVVPTLAPRTGEPRRLDAGVIDDASRVGGTAPLAFSGASPLPACVRALPTYALSVGPSPDAIAEALASIVRTLDGGALEAA
jgi:hypothetical protein